VSHKNENTGVEKFQTNMARTVLTQREHHKRLRMSYLDYFWFRLNDTYAVLRSIDSFLNVIEGRDLRR